MNSIIEINKLGTIFLSFKAELAKLIPNSEIEAWLDSLHLEKCDRDQLVFYGLNKFFGDYVKSNYQELFKKLAFKYFDPKVEFAANFKIVFNLLTPVLEGMGEPLPTNLRELTGLNNSNSFERFINGTNTDIAFAAASAVSENIIEPKYNPLFICGSVGLGKTHLMQAIGLRVWQKNITKKIWYCSAEGFTNNLVEGIRFSKTYETRRKYRNLDLLMIDDIQFLENKSSTQEEFFHTLNELVLDNKQIIITADRYPREMKYIEERLISRFSAGMVAKIEPPTFETRIAIIKNELEFRQLDMSDEVIEHIAYTVKSNVRDLKGMLTKLEAECSLLGLELSLETARSILKDVLDLDKSPKSIDDVIKFAADELNISKQDMLSEKRDREISNARHIAMYITREITDLSYPVIGRYFDKNHTSVIQACKRVKILMEESAEIRQLVQSLIRKITI